MSERLELLMNVAISTEQAQRFLIRRQNFVAYGSPFAGREGVAHALQQMEAVQIDPLCPFERNHHQALYNRVHGYRPEWLDQLLYQDNRAFEYYCNALCVLPMEDYPYFKCAMQQQQVVLAPRVNTDMQEAMQQVMQHIAQQGATSSQEFDSGKKISGWWDNELAARTKIEKQALDYLHLTGKLLISSRTGNQRSYDLPERLVPPALFEQVIDQAAWQRFAMLKFLRAYGLSQLGLFRFGWHNAPKAERKQLLANLVEQDEVARVSIEGVKRTYYCLAADLPELLQATPLSQSEVAVILGPLDNLLWDRDRLEDFWGFNYRWEVYTPASKRQYGYYVVPVLYGEWFVGRIEMRADKEQGVLRVDNLWLEPGHDAALPALRRAVELEAQYLGLTRTFGI